MRSLLKFLVLLFLLVPLILVLYAGYLGFVPGLSRVMGGVRAQELGVAYTKEDYQSYLTKSKSQVIEVSEPIEDKSYSFSGKVNIDDAFSQEELSARLNFSKWKDMPVYNSQIKIGEDGIIEYSGNIRTARLKNFIKVVGGNSFSDDKLDQALTILNKISPNPPVYLKFSASVQKNQANLDVKTIQIGRLNVPLDEIGGNTTVEALATYVLNSTPGFYAESVTFSDGKMYYKGSAPQTIEIQTQ